MPIEPRSEAAHTPPAAHGAPDYAELERLRLTPKDVLDFSVNGNPYGVSPAVRAALAEVCLECYPDRECLALRRRLSEKLSHPMEGIVAGNGSAELLWLIVLAYLRAGDRVLIAGPTFGEYARAAGIMGAQVVEWRARSEAGFAIDPKGIQAALRSFRPRLTFLCNPNNPTGQYLPAEELQALLARAPETLFVIDEAYLAFAPAARSMLELRTENLLVLRSMTKDYALAGLRLGYAVGPSALIAPLAAVRPPWNVSAPAQAAALAALADAEYYANSLAALHAAALDLRAGLAGLGCVPLPSAVHFFLLKVGDAAAFRADLLRRGLQVRDGSSFGLPGHVRIAARRPEENARLISVLREGNLCCDCY